MVQQRTHSLFSSVPEYLNVLGPSAKVKAKGPDTSQSFALGQKTVNVVAVLSCTRHISKRKLVDPRGPICDHQALVAPFSPHLTYAPKGAAAQVLPVLTPVSGHVDRYGGRIVVSGGRGQDGGYQERQ